MWIRPIGHSWIRCSEPASHSCLYRFAFAAVLIVNDHFGAGLARTFCSLIGRSIVDHNYVVESFAGSANDVADMLLILIRRNNRGRLRSYVSERIPLRLYHRGSILVSAVGCAVLSA